MKAPDNVLRSTMSRPAMHHHSKIIYGRMEDVTLSMLLYVFAATVATALTATFQDQIVSIE